MTHDHPLNERFAALRREDAALLRPFHVASPGAVRAPWRPRAVAAALAVTGAAVVWLVTRDRETGVPLDLGSVVWRAPTDFLLETPGRDLLRRLPEIGIIKAY